MHEADDPLLTARSARPQGTAVNHPPRTPPPSRWRARAERHFPTGCRGYLTLWMYSTSFWTSSGLLPRSKPSVLAFISPAL